MIFCGIDPGLEHSSYALVRAPDPARMTAYGSVLELVASGKVRTPSHDLRDWDLADLLLALRLHVPVVTGIEVARGSIRGEISADPVLRNNITAGALLFAVHGAGHAVAAVSAGGQAAGWNWREVVGIKGKGAEERDACLRGILRLRGLPEPRGPRGGVDQDTSDAIGIAAAMFDRATGRRRLGAVDAVLQPDRLSLLTLEKEKTRRAERTRNRALKKALEQKETPCLSPKSAKPSSRRASSARPAARSSIPRRSTG